jgi:phage terminase large subunit GpA-like protein
MPAMSPRIIQLPMSGRDRRHYVRELRAAEQAHRAQAAERDAAFRHAHQLACREWNTRQFIGGDAAPSPTIEQAIHGGCELLEVRCKRCGHESTVDLAEVVWPRGHQVHTLAKALRCAACKDERKKPQPDLVALRPRRQPDPPASAARKVSR